MLKTKVGFIALFISQGIHAAALSSDKDQIDNIEHMVVTGSRVVESIDEVPATITVINRGEIEAQLKISPELQSLLAALVPGLAPNTGSSSNSTQTLRGRSPLVMIDGVPQSTPLRNGSLGIRTLDPNVIQRIEVIKGATSIFGNGAAGGIINYITKQPKGNNKLSGNITLSSRFSAVKLEDSAGSRIEGSINGNIEAFSYVLNASIEENGVQRDAEGDVLGLIYGLSDAEVQNYFSKFGYQFDPDKSIQLTYNHYRSEQDSDLVDISGSVNTGMKSYATPATETQPKPGVAQGPKNDNLMLKYTDEGLTDNTQLVVDAYTQKIKNIFFYSPVLANHSEGYDGGQSLIKSDKKGLRITLNTDIEFESVDARFIYGLDALNDITSQPLVDGREWVPEMDMDNLAAFLQTKWVYNDDLIIKAGVRREDIDLGVDNYNTLKLCRTPDTCSVPVSVKGDTLEYRATTYNLGIRYNLNEAFQPFANYSQGADISDIGRLLRTATVTDIGLIQTEASIIDNYEIGFVSDFNGIHFEFSAYRSTSELGTTNKYDTATGIYLPVRAPQEIYGYEALANYRFSPSLSATATYAWVEGKDTANDVYLGAKQISAPKGTINLNWKPAEDAYIALSYLYVGDRKRFEKVNGEYVGDKGPIDSYHVVNVSSKYAINSDLTVFVGIENLFNQDYFPAKSQAYTYKGYNVKGLGTTVNLGISMQF